MPQQSLSDQHKEAVKAWVPKVRKHLIDEFDGQLKRLGLRADGRHSPIDRMQLPDSDKSVRRKVEALVHHETVGEGSGERGYENVKRELAYTLLNRLVGLKAMEVRKLLFLPPPGRPESTPEETEVVTPVAGQARSRYLRDFRAAHGDRYKYQEDAEESLLRDSLIAAFQHVTREIRVLFDPEHQYACVWPTHACLVQVIGMINDGLPEGAYRAPDFLGWVYQFFRRAENERVRKENKGTPRSSYELGIMNQFYTPGWVVKTLVDNTLGRLWIQMHPDSALRAKEPPPLSEERQSDASAADYLVPRTGENIRYQRLIGEGQVETFKLARDISLLDPACGTMHFGQYAFGLFHQMYVDEIEHAGREGWPAEPSVSDRRRIPAAILENNLFGIDIDPRAIQIATLSLLLTAKEAALRHGYSPLDVAVKRTNLVVANAVNLGEEHLRKLVDRLSARLGSPALREKLFKTIWDNLQYVGELGSLVQVKESVVGVLDDWVAEQARSRGLTRMAPRGQASQLELGSIREDSDRARAKQLELQRAVLEEEADQLRTELLVAVETAAAAHGDDPADRLFAEDTYRGLRLLQILDRQYDAVVMNPPYGSFVPKVKDFIRSAYPLTYNDIYGAFIDRATRLMERHGYVGALVSSTFKTNKGFEKLRTQILLKRNPLAIMLDLGVGILDDATVETAAVVLRGGPV